MFDDVLVLADDGDEGRSYCCFWYFCCLMHHRHVQHPVAIYIGDIVIMFEAYKIIEGKDSFIYHFSIFFLLGHCDGHNCS